MLVLNKILAEEHAIVSNTTVHLDRYSKMTGATNLMQDTRLARYDKDESLTNAHDYKRHNYILTEMPDMHRERFEAIHSIKGWAGLQMQLQPVHWEKLAALKRMRQEGVLDWIIRLTPVRFRLSEQVWIMQRRT